MDLNIFLDNNYMNNYSHNSYIINNQSFNKHISDYTNVSKINKNIFLGNWSISCNEKFLKNNNIKYIVCIENIKKPDYINNIYKKLGIKHVQFFIEDLDNKNIYQYFNESTNIIDKVINNDLNILIHCQAGISRSTTILMAYLISKKNMTPIDAFNYILKKRPVISPNNGFIRQLNEWHIYTNNNNNKKMKKIL